MSPSPRFSNEIERLLRDPDALRSELTQPPGDGGNYDPRQPRVPAGNSDGGQWTSTGGSGEDDQHQIVQRAFFDPRRFAVQGIREGIEAALALFAAASTLNRPDQQAIIEFRARAYEPDAHTRGVLGQGKITLLNRGDVEQACPRFGEVQRLTDQATLQVRSGGGIMSPSQFGTAVHTSLKRKIDGINDPNFRAEVSYLNSEDDARYGARGSIRVDVFERVGNGTVCVYDIKTGVRALEGPRMTSIARKALERFPDTRRIVVTEVRPSR